MGFWDDFFECGNYFLKLQQVSSYEYSVNYSERQTPQSISGWSSSFTGWSNITSYQCDSTIPVEGNALKSLVKVMEYLHETSPYCGCENVVKGDIYDFVETTVYEGEVIDHYNYVFKRDWYYYAAYSLQDTGKASLLGVPVVVLMLMLQVMLWMSGQTGCGTRIFLE